ncbi:StbB family protein [Cupriavidus sp. CP313]
MRSKIAVINFSGNVGKSTVARQLLLPRIPDAQFIAVETVNADERAATGEEAFRGREYAAVQERLLAGAATVVDVGASNIEEFINRMSQFDGSHDDYDLIVVPTVPATKQQRDTQATIAALQDIGVPPEKIRLFFNMLERSAGTTLEKVFEPLFKFHARSGAFTLNPAAALYESDIYSLSAELKRSIADIYSDTTDYKAMIAEAGSPAEKARLAKLLSLRRLATGITREMDVAFAALMG